jgi:hypothetical protein
MSALVLFGSGLLGAAAAGSHARQQELYRQALVRMCRRVSPSRHHRHYESEALSRVDREMVLRATLYGAAWGSMMAMTAVWACAGTATWVARRQAGRKYRFWRSTDGK